MATHVRLTKLERRIIDRVYGSIGGFERVEDLHDAMGADRNDFVEALESLEVEGYLAISNFAGTIIVTSDDPLSASPTGVHGEAIGFSTQVGHC